VSALLARLRDLWAFLTAPDDDWADYQGWGRW